VPPSVVDQHDQRRVLGRRKKVEIAIAIEVRRYGANHAGRYGMSPQHLRLGGTDLRGLGSGGLFRMARDAAGRSGQRDQQRQRQRTCSAGGQT